MIIMWTVGVIRVKIKGQKLHYKDNELKIILLKIH